jgi:mono/diheme cytochrome c family protein
MPPVNLPDAQLNELTALVLKLTPENEASLMAAPDFAIRGATIYESNHCGACHKVNDAGIQIGPRLNGVGTRHDRAWIVQHFRAPQSVSKGTAMPAYPFNDKDMDAIVRYLLSLPV